ncbi:hypothetical protein NMY22_g19324 [Coprinellus aureogranulatus]|nr:hypothetical protein NMY22_g19324 [Coprinellus aureogranulatus]
MLGFVLIILRPSPTRIFKTSGLLLPKLPFIASQHLDLLGDATLRSSNPFNGDRSYVPQFWRKIDKAAPEQWRGFCEKVQARDREPESQIPTRFLPVPQQDNSSLRCSVLAKVVNINALCTHFLYPYLKLEPAEANHNPRTTNRDPRPAYQVRANPCTGGPGILALLNILTFTHADHWTSS